MTDRKKILTAVESLFDYWLDKHMYALPQSDLEKVRQTKEDALELLTKQEPVWPKLRMSKYGFRQWIVCGNCYEKIRGGDYYCSYCGRKIKWD